DFYIGLPRVVPDERLARVRPLSPGRGLLALRYTPPAVTLKMITPGSLLRRSFSGLAVDPTDRAYLDVEVPAGNGVGTARAIARAYSAFAEGGTELGITPETFARLTEPPVVARPKDEVIGLPSYFSLGFLRPGPEVSFGSSQRAFGSPGAGGSFGFADPDVRLGYAYVMNKLDFYLADDPREKALRDAVYRAIARLTSWPYRPGMSEPRPASEITGQLLRTPLSRAVHQATVPVLVWHATLQRTPTIDPVPVR
ncbi:MAG TPA: serine hydrolase, partial [Gemmatimonadales bacterium]